MRKKQNVMILDTETTLKNQEVFDIGILIGDLHGNIKHQQAWLVKENVWRKFWCEERRQLYYSRIMGSYPLEVTGIKNILNRLEELIAEYNIKKVYAYNADFDSDVIQKICDKYQLANPLNKIEMICLWDTSAETFMQTKKYRKFAKDNNFITEKGNIKSSAECAFAYLQGIPEFAEEHTSLEDCKIEYRILLKTRNRKRVRLNGQTWEKVQE
jgi:hypothetical protein